MYRNKTTGELLTDSEFFAKGNPDGFEMVSEIETDTPIAEQMEDEIEEDDWNEDEDDLDDES